MENRGVWRGGKRSREETEGGKGKREKENCTYLVKRKERKNGREEKWNRGGSSPITVLNRDLVAGERNPVSVGSGGGRRAAGPVHARGLQRVTMMFLHRYLHSPSTEPDSVALYRFGNVSQVWSPGFC